MIHKLVALVILSTSIALLSAPVNAEEWQLAGDSSTVRFIGVQEGSGFRGRFEKFSAAIHFDPANTEAGSISGTVKMDSAKTGDAERDATLLEEDWFNPGAFPRVKV